MSSESVSAAPSGPGSPKNETPSLPVLPTATAVPAPADIYKLFVEGTKYTVLGIFALYSIGFIVWHSYLTTFGVSSIGFLQSEYMSAAFCYLFVLAGFALPPAVLLRKLEKKEAGSKLSSLLLLWFLLSSRLIGMFFPDSTSRHDTYWTWAVICGGLMLIGVMIARKKWPENKLLRNLDVMSIGWGSLIIMSLMINHSVNKSFMLSALMFYCFLLNNTGFDVRSEWAQAGLLTKLAIMSFILLVILSNVQQFGSLQFSKIPKQVGGGRPEVAYVKFAAGHTDLAPALGMPPAADPAYSNSFFGPIAILLRTDKEIIFLNNLDWDGPDNITRQIAVDVTNIICITNLVTKPAATNATDISQALHGGVVSYVTNVVKSVKNIQVPNGAKHIAKQVHSDLVEAVVFAQ